MLKGLRIVAGTCAGGIGAGGLAGGKLKRWASGNEAQIWSLDMVNVEMLPAR